LSLIKPNAAVRVRRRPLPTIIAMSTDGSDRATRIDSSRSSALRPMDRSAPMTPQSRRQRLAEALRANLLRRKAKAAASASQDSKKSDDQPTGESIGEESDR